MNSKVNSPQFSGHYRLDGYRVGMDGELIDEAVYSGNVLCSEGKIVAFARLAEGPFGFSGTYTVEGNRFKVKVESCIAPDLEGQTFDWGFEWHDGVCRLKGTEISTGRPFEMKVRKEAA